MQALSITRLQRGSQEGVLENCVVVLQIALFKKQKAALCVLIPGSLSKFSFLL